MESANVGWNSLHTERNKIRNLKIYKEKEDWGGGFRGKGGGRETEFDRVCREGHAEKSRLRADIWEGQWKPLSWEKS